MNYEQIGKFIQKKRKEKKSNTKRTRTKTKHNR